MTVGIIGAGNMAGALARGWGEPVLVSDAGSGRAAALARELGGEAAAGAELARRADIIVLCHKPAQLEEVAQEVAAHARAVVSVLGAVPLARLRGAYPDAQVARMMPNTPVELREGVTCMALDPQAELQFSARVRALFERLGKVVGVPERLMDVATGLSGVLPAYVALIAESLVDAGVRSGLASDQATEIVVAALSGSTSLLRARGGDTLGMRRAVASPGGLTARGLDALERAGLRAAFSEALDAVLAGSR